MKVLHSNDREACDLVDVRLYGTFVRVSICVECFRKKR